MSGIERQNWELWNNNSRSEFWRNEHQKRYGGHFVKDHDGWRWVKAVAAPVVKKPAAKKTTTKKKGI